jgi:hypothetical protein
VKGDGNIGTICQWILTDLHVPGIESVVRRYIVDAMTFHRNKRYFFTDKKAQFNLTSGQADYRAGDGFGLPPDAVEVAGRTIWVMIGGSESQRERCERASHSLFDESVSAWGTSRSQPDVWDWRGKTLRFSPTPTSSDDSVELWYLTNLGIPRVTYENGAFAFYHPVTGEDITSTIDNWENDWTMQEAGAAAIRLRATYSVQKYFLKDMEAAQDALSGWLEAIGQLEDETESKTAGVVYLEGCLL